VGFVPQLWGGTHPIEPDGAPRNFFHVKSAANCVVIALIAAIFGFTGILHWTEALPSRSALFFLRSAYCRYFFSLFEESLSTCRSRKLRLMPQTHAHPLGSPLRSRRLTLPMEMDRADLARADLH
jgi:hypothetical protein